MFQFQFDFDLGSYPRFHLILFSIYNNNNIRSKLVSFIHQIHWVNYSCPLLFSWQKQFWLIFYHLNSVFFPRILWLLYFHCFVNKKKEKKVWVVKQILVSAQSSFKHTVYIINVLFLVTYLTGMHYGLGNIELKQTCCHHLD